LSTTSKIYISCHVVFDETHFPYSLKDNPFLVSKIISTQFVLHSNPLIVIPSNLSNESSNTSISSSNVHDSIQTTILSSINSINLIQHVINDHSIITRAKAGVFKPKLFVTTTTIPVILKIVKEDIPYPSWFPAMKDECNALIVNDTWTLTTLPANLLVVSGSSRTNIMLMTHFKATKRNL